MPQHQKPLNTCCLCQTLRIALTTCVETQRLPALSVPTRSTRTIQTRRSGTHKKNSSSRTLLTCATTETTRPDLALPAATRQRDADATATTMITVGTLLLSIFIVPRTNQKFPSPNEIAFIHRTSATLLAPSNHVWSATLPARPTTRRQLYGATPHRVNKSPDDLYRFAS